MGGVHLLQTLFDVGHHSTEDLSAHDHPRAPHTEVLPGLQGQLAQLVPGPHSCLAQEDGLAAVETAEKAFQPLALDVDVIVSPHEPLVLVQIVVVHVLEHHEGLLLGRVGVVNISQGYDRDGDGGIGPFAGEELHTAWNGLGPRPNQRKPKRETQRQTKVRQTQSRNTLQDCAVKKTGTHIKMALCYKEETSYKHALDKRKAFLGLLGTH